MQHKTLSSMEVTVSPSFLGNKECDMTMGMDVRLFGQPRLIEDMSLTSNLPPKYISIIINICILVFGEMKNIIELKETNCVILVA